MEDLSQTVASAFARYYLELGEKIHCYVDPLSTEQLWKHPYPYGNSIGHLLLHTTGNLNDRIGAQVIGRPYERNRQREFTDDRHQPKEELLKNFDSALAMVVDTLHKQCAEDWSAAYVAKTGPPARDRLSIFIRCLTHCNHHLGQIIYLTKELQRES